MISKIIQKEKERQEEILIKTESGIYTFSRDTILELKEADLYKNAVDALVKVHKQSLINLKEYLRKERNDHTTEIYDCDEDCLCFHCKKLIQLKEDIKELNKMIERYK